MATPFETYQPTADQRRTVRAMAGFGVPQADIATFLKIDPKTLRKHYRDELDQGVTEANAKVAQSLFNMATKQNNVAAAIFWMKARAGWSERQRIEVSAGPLDPSQMTDEQLMRVIIQSEDSLREETE
ncbi:MAG TPA: hypothetical protein VD970_12410, partial [Acetobacteraceae bacterium]|nr:hypothetical protein [Acetobacteraceae bacterium]